LGFYPFVPSASLEPHIGFERPDPPPRSSPLNAFTRLSPAYRYRFARLAPDGRLPLLWVLPASALGRRGLRRRYTRRGAAGVRRRFWHSSLHGASVACRRVAVAPRRVAVAPCYCCRTPLVVVGPDLPLLLSSRHC
jgi:hypothetical protein